MLRLIALPFCRVVMIEPWNAPAHRYFAAYSSRGSRGRLLGHSVLDEFATLSSPVFLAPRSLLGKIYNAGISLGHRRDPAMAIDLGWPPLCVGLEEAAAELPGDWESRLQAALETPPEGAEISAGAEAVRRKKAGVHELECAQVGEASVLVTTAPLLPKQLKRICEVSTRPLAIAAATGNRIERSTDAAPQRVTALSEADLANLLEVAREVQA
jgi:hypothetical protein